MLEKVDQKRSGFIARTLRLTAQLIGVLAIGVVILGGVLAWRLISGPVSIGYLTPYFESALSSRTASYEINVDDTVLKWVGGTRAVDLILKGTRVMSPEGQVFVQIPELSISLSVPALLRGDLAPKSLFISGARIAVIRNIDGSVGIELPYSQRSGEGLVMGLLEEFVRTSGEEAALNELSRVEIDGAAVSVDDRQMGIKWTAPKSNITLKRSADGISGRARFELELGEHKTDVTLNGYFPDSRGEMSLTFGFIDLFPSHFARLSRDFGILRHFDAPITGSIVARINRNGTLDFLNFDLESDAGRVFAPGTLKAEATIQSARFKGTFDQAQSLLEIENASFDFGEKGSLYLPLPVNHLLPIRGLSISAKYWLGTEIFEVEKLIADLNGPRVVARGVIQEIAGEMGFELNATAFQLEMDSLDAYWPAEIGGVPREWVLKKISKGIVTRARAKMSGRWNGTDGISTDMLIGDMDFNDMTIDYLSPMTSAKNVAGSAKFNRRIIEIDLQSGSAPGLSLDDGKVRFTGLDQFDQFANIDLNISGSLGSALKLIDSEPLGFAKAVKLSPDAVVGQGSVRLKLGFLVERATKADDVTISADASLEDVSIPEIILGFGLSDGDLNLKADNDGLKVSGSAKIDKIPVKLIWREVFDESTGERTQISLNAPISVNQFRSIAGISAGPFGPEFVNGEFSVRLTANVNKDRVGDLAVDFDLLDTDVSIPMLGWRKSAKVETMAKFIAKFDGDGVNRISSFELTGGGIELFGNATFIENSVHTINISKLLLGGSDVSGSLTKTEDGWSVIVNGSSLDISAFLDEEDHPNTEAEPGPKLFVLMNIGRVKISEGKHLFNVSGEMENNGVVWTRLETLASVDGGKTLAINLSPAGRTRKLSIGSDDAGAVLKSLGYYENIIGGKLAVKAEYEDMTPKSVITGHALIEDFRLVDAPLLARLLSVASITGIPGELAGAGLAFQQFEVPFKKEDGLISVKGAKAGGFSLGITANGTIDTDLEILDIKGSVAPIDKLNSLLGNIPIFGVFFSGGEKGGGVFAAEYSMRGAFDDPEILTNPLSTITPGILRKIFDVFEDQGLPLEGRGAQEFGLPE